VILRRIDAAAKRLETHHIQLLNALAEEAVPIGEIDGRWLRRLEGLGMIETLDVLGGQKVFLKPFGQCVHKHVHEGSVKLTKTLRAAINGV
tara:strand:+ start:443 stop:715 length:273 start_codon:yes stop_codon:yes gene_type:complete